MFKLKKATKFIALLLPVCILLCTLSCWVGVFSSTESADVVEAASIEDYYDDLNENLTGTAFRTELAQLITTTHTYNPTYGGLGSIFDESDADPNKSGNILWFYTGTSVSFNGSFNSGTNREHVWPKNAGSAFPETSDAGSDAHHLRPTNQNLNSSRGNNSFGEVPQTKANIVGENGSTSYDNLCYQANSVFYPGVGYRGATARILMYVQTRWGDKYNLSFVLGKGNDKTIGDIEDLMKWHIEEPPTEAEIRRNEVVYGVQGNRNPFIDHPEYAEMIYCHDGKSYNDELQNVVKEYGSYLGNTGDPSIEVEDITISPNAVNLAVGETSNFTATVYPAGAISSVKWTSSKPNVASINNGVVTAVSSGTTTITATSVANETIKATAVVNVKAVSSIKVTGNLIKTEYSAGDAFNPGGLVVTATYSDGSTATINNGSCDWLDGTTNAKTLEEGSTSVICRYAGMEDTFEGITVKKATTYKVTITRDSFSGSGAYNWIGWTADNVSGQAFMYPGNTTNIQMNSSKTSQFIYNTTPISGGIVSITMKTTGDKDWKVYTSTTPYTAVSGVPTTGTEMGTFTSTPDGGTLNLGTQNQYFTINYVSTGAVYIEEIVIVCGSSHVHTPGEWIVDKEATCSSSGSRHNECTECGEIVNVEEITALSHSYGTWAVTLNPTCKAEGREESVCAVCGEKEERSIERADHEFSEWVVVAMGIEARECINCDHKEERATADLEKVEAFCGLVEKVIESDEIEEKLTAIDDALEFYKDLSDSEKDAVKNAYETLKQEIVDYNAYVTEINDEASKAVNNAILFYIGAISALAFAAYFLLKI